MAFCDSLKAFEFTVSVRNDVNRTEPVWEASGSLDYKAGEPLILGVAPAGMTADGEFDPTVLGDRDVYVLISGTDPDSSDSDGIEARFKIGDLDADGWLNNDGQRSEQPCA